MQGQRRWLILLMMLLGAFARGAAANGFERVSLTVDGVVRTALVYAPTNARSVSTPVVFVFHGHGGSAESALQSFAINRHWPEAISVYMQGLDTPGQLTDPQGNRPGWQAAVGDQGDRDLKFFDAMLSRLKQDYKVDAQRIYCTGHSNGGAFTYLLWLARGNVFAAMAPSAAAAKYANQLTPKPALIMGGTEDPLVSFAWQKLTVYVVSRVNGCAATGETWDKDKQCTIYPSQKGAPLVTFIYPGGHEFNSASPALIVKFFKEHPAEAGK
ncbi:MAG TPA: prolyl oligopeptidase family serine peptidase [Candidatus Polarisedimenticolia bacterium]|nr:prolyl oligopeptidase family serine peptidase [Candidatus Polarisedimenticolia bacterium]